MALTDIKRISIREYLEARGIKPQRERSNRAMYLSPLRQEDTASFSVNHDENVWYDFGLGAGGSIIDLVARMENCSVGEAIRRWYAECGRWCIENRCIHGRTLIFFSPENLPPEHHYVAATY